MTVIDQATLPKPLGFVTREDARNVEAGTAECMLMMREQTGKFERPVYSSPERIPSVPPACGEVEIAGYAGRNAVKGFMNNGSEVSVMLKPERFFDIPLTPLENVTRLQAENAALQHRLTIADQRVDDLKSELTKARELNKQLGTEVIQLLPFLEDDFDNLQLEDSSLPVSTQQWNKVGKLAADTLAHQSAPAAKGGA